jgi:hypothetical protein
MYGTFNMGIGMMLVVDEKDAGPAVGILEEYGEKAYRVARSGRECRGGAMLNFAVLVSGGCYQPAGRHRGRPGRTDPGGPHLRRHLEQGRGPSRWNGRKSTESRLCDRTEKLSGSGGL